MPPQGGAVPTMSITAKGRGKRGGEVPETGTETGQGEGCYQQQSCASFTVEACVTASCPHLGEGPVPFLSGQGWQRSCPLLHLWGSSSGQGLETLPISHGTSRQGQDVRLALHCAAPNHTLPRMLSRSQQ